MKREEYMEKNSKKAFKIIMLILIIAIIVAIIYYLFPVVKNLSTPEGQVAFKEKISNSGVLGFLMLFGLQFAQIFLFIIPGEPIEILAGICYGPIWGTIFVMISAAIITLFIYLLVHKFGRKFIYDFCGEEKIKKIENAKVFKNPKTIGFIIFILFFIPGTPKDLFTFIAALFPIKPLNFIIISTIARFPSIISSTLAGDNLLAGNWKMSLIVYGVTFLIVGIIILCMRKFDKDKVTDEVLKSIK